MTGSRRFWRAARRTGAGRSEPAVAYLQGGAVKLTDFPGAIGEMTHFGLSPAPLFAVLVIALELGASMMILTGWLRWLGAFGLAAFTLLATGIALRFWELPAGQERFTHSQPGADIRASRKGTLFDSSGEVHISLDPPAPKK